MYRPTKDKGIIDQLRQRMRIQCRDLLDAMELVAHGSGILKGMTGYDKGLLSHASKDLTESFRIMRDYNISDEIWKCYGILIRMADSGKIDKEELDGCSIEITADILSRGVKL